MNKALVSIFGRQLSMWASIQTDCIPYNVTTFHDASISCMIAR